jgi:cell division protein FtsA
VDGVGNLKKPLGKKGGRLNVSTIIVAAPKDTIDSLEQTLHSAQLTARSMVYRPVASALSVTEEDERIEGVAVADIGGWTTDLAIFANGRMEFAMTLPVGGSHITSDLASLLNMSFEDADELKKSEVEFPGTGVSDGKVSQVRQIGSEASRPIKQQVLCEIAECRILEIAKFIRREIEKSGYSRQIVASIVLTGGTANIRGIERVFKREFDNMRCVTKAPSVASHPKRALNDPSLASATGIALFTLSSEAEDLEPASGQADWKQRVKAFWSLVGNGN